MFCSKCGSQANSDAKFCEGCGTPFPVSAEGDGTPPVVPTAPPPTGGVAPSGGVAPTYTPPPTGGVAPQQQEPWQQPQYAGAQQQYPGQYNAPKKNSNTAIIIVASVLAVALIIGGVFLFSSRSGGSGGSGGIGGIGGSRNENSLVGRWNEGSGRIIYYFEESTEIEFFAPNSDGIGLVYDDYGEWGEWYINANGILCIEGEQYFAEYGVVELMFDIRENVLTLTDTDGDTRSYRRR